jgi:ArsR family transcriptional regulator
MDEHAAVCFAKALKALADPVRLRLLSMLAQVPQGRVSASALADAADRTQSTVSHHLKALRQVGLIRAERQGSIIWYSLRRDRLEELLAMLDMATLPLSDHRHRAAQVPQAESSRTESRLAAPRHDRGGGMGEALPPDGSRAKAPASTGPLVPLRCSNPACTCFRGNEQAASALR